MHTETDGVILNSMQEQQHHHPEHTPHQQQYMTLLSQDQIMPEQLQQQVFAHLPPTTPETTIALGVGYYAPTPQQHLTSECLSQYYNGTTRLGYPPTSSSSSSSSSNSSSDESIYSCPRSFANQNCKNNTNKHTASIGVNLRVTGQCSQGGRKYMEDYFSVAYQQSENAKDLEYAFIGIYDGHGGAEAAKFAKEHLMMEIINQRLFWSDNDHDVLRAIREGYIATHYAMWREQDKWPKTANGLPSTAGTTATVAFIRREKIYIGHVGDSGIVLGYQNENENFWRAKQLTVDHKPESVEERTRIMNSGGKVVVKSGVPRVVWNRPRNASHRGPIRKKTVIDEIPFLAVARSLGDLWSYNSQRNEFVVSPDPDVKVIPINSNTFRCLIFGTDGLWNVVSAQAAVNTVHEKEMLNERLFAQRDERPYEGNQLTNPSKSLVDQALHTWSNKKMRADNTSVVTVILYPPGQVDHSSNAGCKEMHKAANNPPAFLQPVSYGLEYTQVQAEVPVYDDTTTYKEMALKYLAPEAYRNFNYYAEESDTEGNDNEESEGEAEGEEHDVLLTAKPPPGDLQQNTNYQQHFSTANNWKWEDNNPNNYTIGKDRQGEEEEDEEDEQEDEEEDEENVKDQATKEKHVNSNQRQVCIINYENFVRNEAEETNNATDSYINTFAESYNSLLTASQDKCVTTATTSSSSPSNICSNSNSNSNSNCQSVTPPNMHAILQEQQLYQQQCMSEEEGYSLTKLETRREQQTCSSHNSSSAHVLNESTAAVQTFKIFHDLQGQLLPQNPPQQIELYHDNTARFYHHQQQQQPQQQQQFMPKPLELHSLLQQEREEEQQVAYERLQMENKLQQQHQNISAYACLQTTNSTTTPLEEPPSVEIEYLEEEDSVAAEEIITTETHNSSACMLQDESVQINEISSSSCVDESIMETSCSDKWPKTANGLPSTAGTTATVAFIRREKIYIGHVGDSGIVLGYQNENENFWRAKQLTVDHKPESVEERTRIMNSGGKVVVKSGVPRVVWNRPRNASHRGPIRKKTVIDEIPFLAVARSLGDLWSYNSQRNEFVVSPDPDVKVIPINSNTFRCLIFGTDGLWNVVSAQAAVNTVHEKEMLNERLFAQRDERPYEGNQLTNPSKSLVDQALHTWSNKKMRADNTSVVTVILYPPGQVDHSSNAGCKEMHKAANNPPAFLQPVSYGLEYTQVQAEVPVYDDTTTYKEMALKYLAPEAYRNFNYYAEESDTEGNDNEESEGEAEGEEHDVLLTAKPPPGDLQQNTNYQQHFSTANNWKWEDNNPNNYTIGKDRQGEEEEDEEDEQEDEEEDEENVKDQATKEKHVNSNQRQVCIINYENFVRNEAEETNNATDSYINTFAESYNSLLTASQDKCVTTATTSSSSPSNICSNSNSNSNSNCQSVTPPNMHAILQEQQLYQQQCMSEEEGYSLTKLETRREQQTCSSHNSSSAHVLNESTAAVQTFKIFHDLQGQLLPQNPPQQIELYHDNTARFYHHQQQQQPQQQQQFMPKPLELHSLLQQEREEEQQVAYERLQMENKLQQQHQNISAYACLQTTNSTTTPLEEPPSVEIEYLEEEDSVAAEEIITTETHNSSACMLQDESVQINEISSSSCVDESIMETSCSGESGLAHNEIIEKIEILPNVIMETNTEEYSEEIKSSKYTPLNTSNNNITCHLPSTSLPKKITPAPSALALTSSFKPRLNRSKRTKSSYLYNNVPNENLQRISNTKYNHGMYFDSETTRTRKRSMCMTPSGSKTSSVTMTPPAATSTPIIQRQLRSTATPPNTPNATPVMDYGKRTLRTRNSLSKDMKAKSALVQAALKYPPNTVTRNFLRTTAANLIVGKPLHLNDINVTPCQRRALGTANSVRKPNRKRTRREKANVVFNGSSHSQLNLRSRHMTSSPSSAVASTPVIKRASLTERRILRSSPSKGSQNPANFSKTTRTQSTGSNLAAPPPSPKLINAVAAVAAATRARSLLNAKHVAAANGTQSVVSAVFGKRSSLRSNGTTHPNTNKTSSLSPPASTHQTLSGRIVKKLKR